MLHQFSVHLLYLCPCAHCVLPMCRCVCAQPRVVSDVLVCVPLVALCMRTVYDVYMCSHQLYQVQPHPLIRTILKMYHTCTSSIRGSQKGLRRNQRLSTLPLTALECLSPTRARLPSFERPVQWVGLSRNPRALITNCKAALHNLARYLQSCARYPISRPIQPILTITRDTYCLYKQACHAPCDHHSFLPVSHYTSCKPIHSWFSFCLCDHLSISRRLSDAGLPPTSV